MFQMKLSREIYIGAIIGLVIGLPQGLRDLPSFSAPVSSENLSTLIIIGCITGFFLGMHLFSRANTNPKKHAIFAFLFVSAWSIGLPTVIRHYNGNIFESINILAALFISLGVSMIAGGILSGIASKNI